MAPAFSRVETRSSNPSQAARPLLRLGVGLATALALIGGIAGERDANAYAVKRTTRGELVHWEQGTIGYTIDPSLDLNVENASVATNSAMASWSGTVGAPELQATTRVDPPTKPGFDQKNGIFFMKGGYAPAGRALAITVLTYDNASGRILDADIIFNGSYSFQVLSESGMPMSKATSGTHPSATDSIAHDEEERSVDMIYDLHHVIAHEVGHSVGMNDEMDRREALMYRYSAPNDASVRTLASDDIAGLAELYSTRLEGQGNGCGNATVAPKKPSHGASHLAMFATLAFLGFLFLRARSDRRARYGFVAAATIAAVAFVPSISKDGAGVARASTVAPGHARAKVLATETTVEAGLFKTTYQLATTACRATTCPKLGHGSAWGGTIGDIRQEVGDGFAPTKGDEVDVSFAKLPAAMAPLSKPLAGRDFTGGDEAVRVLTHAL